MPDDFVTFEGLIYGIREQDVDWLIEELASGMKPSEDAVTAREAIELAVRDGNPVRRLNSGEKSAILGILIPVFDIRAHGVPEGSHESLRWFEEDLRESLGEGS
jgi:hypothetical protein